MEQLTKVQQVALTIYTEDRRNGAPETAEHIKTCYERAYSFLDVSKDFKRRYE